MTALQALIRYPLQLPCLLAGLVLCGFALLLRLTYETTRIIGDMGVALWLAVSASAIFVCGWLLLEYCLNIVEHSANGSERAPGLRNPMRDGGAWDFPRAFKLAVLIAIWGGTGQHLYSAELPVLAWIIWTFGLLLLPAALAQCAVFDNLLQALNPLALLKCAIECRYHYPFTLVLLLPITLFIRLALNGSVAQFAFFALLAYYSLCLWCRVTGLGLRDYQTQLLQAVDFNAARNEQARHSEAMAPMHKMLTSANELMRAGRPHSAQQLLVDWLDASQWQDFDEIFAHVSTGPLAGVGVALADRQLTHIVQQQHLMRGLSLLEWCLSQQPDYAPGDLETLAMLAAHSATVSQHKAVLHAIENVLAQQPAPTLPPALIQQALLLAGTKLKDEKWHARLSLRFATLNSSSDK